MYIGKLKVWQKKVPETFIDDALDKFRLHELEKTTKKQQTDEITSETYSDEEQMKNSHSTTSLNQDSSSGELPSVNKSVSLQNISSEDEKRKNLPPASVEIDNNNRTMVLQVDRTDLRLISPDRKVVLMHKHHKEVTTCVQGIKNSEHFGFICRETVNQQTVYVGFVFKCESQSVASDAVQAITQAFTNAESRQFRNQVTSCEHCPMVWYHKLCAEIEHLSDRKTQAAIFRRIDQLDDDEQSTILTKFRGVETDSITEQNEFLMMLLRAHCEMKQARHVHDTAENRSEFLNQYLGGGTGNKLFSKAKRSLTSSFDHLLKRKASRDDFSTAGISKELSLPIIAREPTSPVGGDTDSEGGNRSRTSTISSQNDETRRSSISDADDKTFKSPMMDM